MTTLKVILNDQVLIAAEKVKIASGDINSVALAVETDELWDIFPNRTASFYTSHNSEPHEVLLIDGQCVIPAEVLSLPGILYVGIVGVSADGESAKTSSIASFKIIPGASHTYTTVKPELDLYQQYLKATKEETAPAIKAMQAAYEKAQADLEADYAEAKAYFEANCVKACDYSNVLHTFAMDTEWTATEDCWVFGSLFSSYTSAAILKINNVEVAKASQTVSNGADTHPTGSFFVKKGSTVLVSINGTSANSVVKAYGCIS